MVLEELLDRKAPTGVAQQALGNEFKYLKPLSHGLLKLPCVEDCDYLILGY